MPTTVGAGTLALPSSIGDSGWLGLILIFILLQVHVR